MTKVEELLHSLNESEVRYLIVGAMASAVHGWVPATADLDLFVDPEPTNLERLREAFIAFG